MSAIDAGVADLEASLDNPAGSPDQIFALMLLQRIEKLETTDARKDALIGELEARVRGLELKTSRLELKTYDANSDEFSDGFFVDWFVWEPVATAHVCRCDVTLPMAEEYASAYVVLPMVDGVQNTEDIEIHVPVARFRDATRAIVIPRGARLDVKGLLERIHAFYQTPIGLDDLADRDDDGNDDYLTDARAKLGDGGRVVWADLIGEPVYFSGDASTENRRHGFCCSGAVRFEAIRAEAGRLVLRLGS